MDPLREIGRALLVLGAVLVIVGGLLYFSGKLPFRLGRLPGDISWQGKHATVYFPIVTCIAISVLLTFVFWLISYFRK
jgi:hypothetical protein